MNAKILYSALVAVIAFGSTAPGQTCPSQQGDSPVSLISVSHQAPVATEQADIVDTAVGAEKFKTLVAAVKAAGLVDVLKGEGPFTVFAPTDEAFKKLPVGTVESLLKEENRDKLRQILTYHVVKGKVLSTDVVKLTEAPTAQGEKIMIKVEGKKVMFNGSTLVKADIQCTNGVIHVIDKVLIPGQNNGTHTAAKKDIVDTATAAGQFKTLLAAAKAAGLVQTLKGEGPFTVFAPTDEAFSKIPAETIQDLLKPENREKLAGILKYHVVAGKVMAADVVKLQKAKTVNGQEVGIKVTDKGGVMLDDANVIKTDIECGNGVIHVIDKVIMPQ